jgi:uncharacterized membrane protein
LSFVKKGEHGSGGAAEFANWLTSTREDLATLKGWSAQIALIDMAWGAALSGVAGAIGYFAVRAWADG